MQAIEELNKGAINAIRGYRRQFLYSLYRLLKDINCNYIFEPEGFFEDLDIKDNTGKYLETIQVKNTSGTLTFSDLFSKKDSFFKRAKKAISYGTERVKLVCFGELSEELKDPSLSKIKKKLKKKGFTEAQINGIAKVYDYEVVTEEEIQTIILEKIKGFEIFNDPFIGMDLLLFWLYQVAEEQTSITKKDFITQLNQIGKYISERIDFHKSFGNTIRPLEVKYFSDENIEKYKEAFYFGVSAKYEHILANVDITRSRRLVEVDEAFRKNNVVFIHGASGQGKSSLAYRYLKNSKSQYSSYELKLSSNFIEVRETINSLESLCKGLNFPVVLYIDVTSQYSYWEEVIKELYDKSNIHFLVTIRQEDWNKLSFEHQFNYSDIELSFDKEEAKQLYYHFSSYIPDRKFISFDESWKQVGEFSPLLEYVYFLTQGVTLKSRLREQIRRIQEKVEIKRTKEIELLRFVCLSDSFSSRINYKSLVQHLEILNPNLYIEDFSKEYLVKLSEDGFYLIGLHPVRSKIIYEILFGDNDLVDKDDYIDKALTLIHEDDLHSFLLNSFDNNYLIDRCINSLSKVKIETWTGYNNVAKALIWKGIYDYVFVDNYTIFNKCQTLYGSTLFLNLDFSGIRQENALADIFKSFIDKEEDQEEAIKKYENINKELASIDDAYKYCIRWVNTDLVYPLKGVDDRDWNACGEYLFRLSLFTHIVTSINIDSDELKSYINKTNSVESIAAILLGLKSSNLVPSIDTEHLEHEFRNKIREYYNIVNLEISEKKVNTKYFFDFIDFDPDESVKNPFHDRTLEIQGLMRKAFPLKKEYEIKGYGYDLLKLSDHDDTYKCMPRNNIPVKLLVEQNVLINNLYNYSLRLETWQEFVDRLVENRKVLLLALESIRKGLVLYFKDNIKGINYLTDNEKKIKGYVKSFNHSLPQCTIDKWGYKGDNDEIELDANSLDKTDHKLSIHKFEELKEAMQEYFSYSQNFINQSFTQMNNTLCRINDSSFKVENENLANVTEYNLFHSANYLLRFHKEFDRSLSKFILPHIAKSLSEKETLIIMELMTIWKEFLYSSYRINKSVAQIASLTFELTKNQLLQTLYKEVINTQKETGIVLRINTNIDEKRLIIQVETNSEFYLESIEICLDVVFKVFSSLHHSSVKSLLTNSNFNVISILPTFNSHPINDKYLDLPIHRIDKAQEMLYSEKQINNVFEIFQFPSEITRLVQSELKISPWNERINEVKSYEKVMGVCSSVKIIFEQYIGLKTEFETADRFGYELISAYKTKFTNHFLFIIEQVESEIDEIYSLEYFELEFLKDMKDNINAVTDFLYSTQSINEFGIEDHQLIKNSAEFLEANYLQFSEKAILNYLDTLEN